jgi:3-hydroxypropanoate dehydrogenase
MLSDEGLDLIFRTARTHKVWLDRPVPDDLLRRVYDLARLGPTSANCSPMRVLFLTSRAARGALI